MRVKSTHRFLRRSPSVVKNLDKFASNLPEFNEAKKIYYKPKDSLKNDIFEKNVQPKSCECYFKY